MRFLVDECIGPSVAKWLKDNGHQVYSVYDESRGLDDNSILKIAFEKNYILITNDSDFGELIFRQKRHTMGVILIRLAGLSTIEKAEIVVTAVKEHANTLSNAFTVITSKTIRIRKLA